MRTPPSQGTGSCSVKTLRQARTRVSPYPQRVRYPVTLYAQSSSGSPQPREIPECDPDRVPAQELSVRESSGAAQGQGIATPTLHESLPELPQHTLQQFVQPIVKSTISQRETSGEMLEILVATGSTIDEIMSKIWSEFSSRVKAQSMKRDDLKRKKHLVDSTTSQLSWNTWLFTIRGETITLLIYEYGISIAKGPDLKTF
ncbi:hypothetical protein PHMEG_00015022 [Phytophthora megakarya]|uniref:Uncharacterized protein n=1 Tax=Phytophthora megakarya TaxID=4795 RepID=A0A225W2C0_9STRA|nr:hypothetical protein PHMEG_00015022 [Phytophthora megakarya]